MSQMIPANSASVMADAPINPEWIISGKPITRCRGLAASGGTDSGYWDCTGGVFRWHYSVNETILILEGYVRLRDLRDPHLRSVALVPGQTMMFPAGAVVEWTVPTYVLKFFVLSSPRESILLKIYRRLRR